MHKDLEAATRVTDLHNTHLIYNHMKSYGTRAAYRLNCLPIATVYQFNKCDWLWENPPVMHKYNYLEKRN